ncbi:MAG TPA: hypothetical protein VMW40_03120 [Candidatus Bathyarchaeia archaeon]|nr:hypothetical protein [Candidatus Bathyarchaeia archaeon]
MRIYKPNMAMAEKYCGDGYCRKKKVTLIKEAKEWNRSQLASEVKAMPTIPHPSLSHESSCTFIIQWLS